MVSQIANRLRSPGIDIKKEKRKHQRLYILASLELELLEDSTLIEAYANNISYGGMGLYTKNPLPVGQPVCARIRLLDPHEIQERETITGCVRWCRPVGAFFAAGIEFDRIDEDLNPGLVSFLEQTQLPMSPCKSLKERRNSKSSKHRSSKVEL
jgi:Tfp pilus assembly protein PilZ